MIHLNIRQYQRLKNSVITLLFLFIGINKTIAQEGVFSDYNNFLVIRPVELLDKTTILTQDIKSVDTSLKGAEYINKQPLFWDYLLVNYTEPEHYKSLKHINDTVALQRAYIPLVTKDASFVPLVTDYVDKVVVKTVARDTVSMNEIVNIAVKFFSITRITEKGEYVGKICVGVNDIKNTETKRKPHIEAFAFNAIRKNLENKQYNLHPYFIDAITKIYALNLGVNNEDRLLRAQGALFIQMLQSDQLIKLLEDEYNSDKDILPFILKPRSS
ncbi:hypothetical protein [Myroides marinus]|uniref:hypothetical protein n=1 Tax=Myroides marinus TaxID=703342 RepID=UPI002578E0B2|nr:hypothetical protein [Myroides marinus]MDM1380535.1 hypothetical protein [Myroides marinus]MDM1387788.1 hypothetical protein [Myroides marinus]MDM1395019.1 hypothetical protein [Myroides marinus]